MGTETKASTQNLGMYCTVRVLGTVSQNCVSKEEQRGGMLILLEWVSAISNTGMGREASSGRVRAHVVPVLVWVVLGTVVLVMTQLTQLGWGQHLGKES